MSDLIFSIEQGAFGDIGFITLNRVKALNALTQEMITSLYDQLLVWNNAKNIKAVVIRSNSKKAFCAGGDVVQLHELNKQSSRKSLAFFKTEYLLNCLIRAYKKPYIALLDGLTLGGGVGISLHGRYPIATENFSFSMPETGIGFFPDVGGGYLLSRCKGALGVYLGLTGKRIKRADAKAAGLLNHTLCSNEQSVFIERLLALDLSDAPDSKIEDLLAELLEKNIEEAPILAHLEDINDTFGEKSLIDIFLKLEALSNDWSVETLKILNSKSPTALLVTFEQLKRVKDLSMEETMRVEYRMSYNFLKNKDFSEGVRALLVDKDLTPNWDKIDYTKDNQALVASYFSPLENEFF